MIKLTEKFGARGIKVPWDGVVYSLNLHEDILEIFSGVSKKPETETNLLVSDARVANPAKPFQFGHKTHQSLKSAKPSLSTLENSHTWKITFYFLTWILTPL